MFPSMTPEYRKAYNAKKYASMTAEQRERRRIQSRKWYESMTPEQRAASRKCSKEWQKKPEILAKKRAHYHANKSYWSERSKRLKPKRTAREQELRKIDPMWAKTPGRQFSQYKFHASERGHDFGLSKEEFMSFWQKPCHYCGDAIASIGIDRLDNSKGYYMNNCVPCCAPCNWSKMAMSPSEFIDRAHRIASRHKPCVNS